jgi:sulfur-carrier protein
MTCDGATVREVLNKAFDANPRLRTYVLDDQGSLRKHMSVLVDGRAVADRDQQRDLVAPGSEVWVMQALSGG